MVKAPFFKAKARLNNGQIGSLQATNFLLNNLIIRKYLYTQHKLLRTQQLNIGEIQSPSLKHQENAYSFYTSGQEEMECSIPGRKTVL